MGSYEIYEQIRSEKIIAIVRGISKEKIVGVAKALLAGGIKLMEVTCNTANVGEMISLLSKEMKGQMVIGAGTVISKEVCKYVHAAGAKYMVAPDVNPEVVEYCVGNDIAVLPGAATATEVLTAKRLGAKMVKIFPAAQIGVDYIKMLRGPIDNMDFVAVGGVRLNTIKDFVAAGCVGIGIGGSVVKEELVASEDWASLSEAASLFTAEIESCMS